MSMHHCPEAPHGRHAFEWFGPCRFCLMTKAGLKKREQETARAEINKMRAMLGMETLTRKVALADLIGGAA